MGAIASDMNRNVFPIPALALRSHSARITSTLTVPGAQYFIDGVEITQAIQQYQPINDLLNSLQTNGEPPVPIVAGKLATLRVMMKNVTAQRLATVRLSGDITATHSGPLFPGCTQDDSRRNKGACRSIDFDFTPTAKPLSVAVETLDDSNNVIEHFDLKLNVRTTNTLVFKAVSVCATKTIGGAWDCSDPGDLVNSTGLASKIFPAAIRIEDAKLQVMDPFDNSETWWNDVSHDVADRITQAEKDSQDTGGRHVTYFGGIKPSQISGSTAGWSAEIPGNGVIGALSPYSPKIVLSAHPELGLQDVFRGYDWAPTVLAHETAHSLGRSHTGLGNPHLGLPFNPATSGGCFATAPIGDEGTDWIYPDNLIQHPSNKPEVGFDVVTHSPVLPESNFELMGYCLPVWISPFTYMKLIDALHEKPAPHAPLSATPVSTGAFWTISGLSPKNGVPVFKPIFQVTGASSAGAGTGTWRIEVQNAAGTALFTRNFTPAQQTSEDLLGENTDPGPPRFSEFIPVTAGATRIVLFTGSATAAGTIALGGVAPTVSLLPLPGTTVSGPQTLSWTVTDPDSSSFTSRVFYSADNGTTRSQIGGATTNSLQVDFDRLPGSNGGARIRVDVSDGVNMGTASSVAFSVPKKLPAPGIILSPAANAIFRPGDAVLLRGSVHDVDDGFLTGSALHWSSNLDGNLGTGSELPVLTLRAGSHTITLTGTDSDGNSTSATVPITVAGAAPTVNLTFTGLDKTPVSCVQVRIATTTSNVALASAEYSFDNGTTWIALPVASLPATIAAPC